MGSSRGVIALALLVAGVFSAGCTNLITINSDPMGADCYVNEEYRGMTPLVTAVESWALGPNPRLRLEKKGYNTFSGILRKRVVARYILVDLCAYVAAPIAWMCNSALVDGVYHFPLCKSEEEDAAAEAEKPDEAPAAP